MGGKVKIVVLDRGWVFVGRVSVTDDGDIRIENAQCVRRWGTTQGLGQLRSGPTNHTVVDPAGTVIAPARSVVFMLDVEDDAWKSI